MPYAHAVAQSVAYAFPDAIADSIAHFGSVCDLYVHNR
jgi:hypothetical protein